MSEIGRYRDSLPEPEWARSAMERAVQRDGRIMRAINAEKDRTARDASRRDVELGREFRRAFVKSATDIYEDEDKSTGPRVRRLTQTVDQELLQIQKQQLLGYYRLATEQFALQIRRDITPERPKPASYWQEVAWAVFGG